MQGELTIMYALRHEEQSDGCIVIVGRKGETDRERPNEQEDK